VKEIIAENRDSPYEEKIFKIIRVEDHHENDRNRLDYTRTQSLPHLNGGESQANLKAIGIESEAGSQ
jgi:hypothetical protein